MGRERARAGVLEVMRGILWPEARPAGDIPEAMAAVLEGRLHPELDEVVELPELEPLLRRGGLRRLVVVADGGLGEDARAFGREVQAIVGLPVELVRPGQDPRLASWEEERALVVVLGAGRLAPTVADAPVLRIGDEPGEADARLSVASWAGKVSPPVDAILRRLVLRMVALWIAVRTTRHPDELRGFAAETAALPQLAECWLDGCAYEAVDVAPHLEPFMRAVYGLRSEAAQARLEPLIAM